MLEWEGETDAAPSVKVALHFARGGGRTFIKRQFVPYPFHITRPHARKPELATLILQSASGGLYGGDRLAFDLSTGVGARAHVTSQAATVVHAAERREIAVRIRLHAGPDSFLALTTDPNILFPNTKLSVQTDIVLGPNATVVIAEGFATHDPEARDRAFRSLATRCRIAREGGILLVDEASAIEGRAYLGPGSPLGPYRAMGTIMVLGEAASYLQTDDLPGQPDGSGVLSGATTLPNGAGVCVRVLAIGGGQLARALDTGLDMVRSRLNSAAGPSPGSTARGSSTG